MSYYAYTFYPATSPTAVIVPSASMFPVAIISPPAMTFCAVRISPVEASPKTCIVF